MFKQIAIVLLCSVPAMASWWMDAAEVDMNGNPLSPDATKAFLRLAADNSGNVEDMTGVLFDPVVEGGGGYSVGIAWDDPTNPWYGAVAANQDFDRDNAHYYPGMLTTHAGYQPLYKGWYLEGNANYVLATETDLEAFWGADVVATWDEYTKSVRMANLQKNMNRFSLDPGVIPAGIVWGGCLLFTPDVGSSEVHLFSGDPPVAVNAHGVVYDDDPRPQTAPEPATLGLLALGGLALLRRHRLVPS